MEGGCRGGSWRGRQGVGQAYYKYYRGVNHYLLSLFHPDLAYSVHMLGMRSLSFLLQRVLRLARSFSIRALLASDGLLLAYAGA